jgi:hypothetical protein
MEWQIMLAIILAVPFLILVVLFVWFVNLGGICHAIRRRHRERAAHKFEAAIALELLNGAPDS